MADNFKLAPSGRRPALSVAEAALARAASAAGFAPLFDAVRAEHDARVRSLERQLRATAGAGTDAARDAEASSAAVTALMVELADARRDLEVQRLEAELRLDEAHHQVRAAERARAVAAASEAAAAAAAAAAQRASARLTAANERLRREAAMSARLAERARAAAVRLQGGAPAAAGVAPRVASQHDRRAASAPRAASAGRSGAAAANASRARPTDKLAPARATARRRPASARGVADSVAAAQRANALLAEALGGGLVTKMAGAAALCAAVPAAPAQPRAHPHRAAATDEARCDGGWDGGLDDETCSAVTAAAIRSGAEPRSAASTPPRAAQPKVPALDAGSAPSPALVANEPGDARSALAVPALWDAAVQTSPTLHSPAPQPAATAGTAPHGAPDRRADVRADSRGGGVHSPSPPSHARRRPAPGAAAEPPPSGAAGGGAEAEQLGGWAAEGRADATASPERLRPNGGDDARADDDGASGAHQPAHTNAHLAQLVKPAAAHAPIAATPVAPGAAAPRRARGLPSPPSSSLLALTPGMAAVRAALDRFESRAAILSRGAGASARSDGGARGARGAHEPRAGSAMAALDSPAAGADTGGACGALPALAALAAHGTPHDGRGAAHGAVRTPTHGAAERDSSDVSSSARSDAPESQPRLRALYAIQAACEPHAHAAGRAHRRPDHAAMGATGVTQPAVTSSDARSVSPGARTEASASAARSVAADAAGGCAPHAAAGQGSVDLPPRGTDAHARRSCTPLRARDATDAWAESGALPSGAVGWRRESLSLSARVEQKRLRLQQAKERLVAVGH
ncbi:hypothetical protein KFE25_004714 [Diacronema lutheri]|uniref:Uncharacterized protein n=1 Tax=Diacronema lutheri TaxID=2081491 RepID=A0A8J5XA82_DIALT|nr:hypothetical protein KFE25_004714 [Diacronema lutheri]